jgi:transmembrane sensor
MSKPSWDALGQQIDPRFGPERERAARLAIEERAGRRRLATRAATSVLALALVAALAVFVRPRPQTPTVASTLPSLSAPQASEVATVTVMQLSPDTVVEPLPDAKGRGFTLRSGGARFVVQHDVAHPFVVVAGDITIEDLGTTFSVEYLPGDRLEVAVDEGRVKVRAAGADTEIAAGDSREFALPVAPAALEKSGPAPASAGPVSWRPLAESGRYDEARAALKKAGPNAVRDETADLLLAADAARLGGSPGEAVPYLERVVRGHAGDPRSSLAAFTLGRVLLDELGHPREAAEAFARARAAGGPLAEDALARQVEATSRAGDTSKSRELAREYQTRYPHGRRAKAVARFGGLD